MGANQSAEAGQQFDRLRALEQSLKRHLEAEAKQSLTAEQRLQNSARIAANKAEIEHIACALQQHKSRTQDQDALFIIGGALILVSILLLLLRNNHH